MVFLLFFRNWVVTMTSPRVTTTDAFRSQKQALDWAVSFQCLYHVRGTSRIETTCVWQYRTNNPLVQFNRKNKDVTKNKTNVTHLRLFNLRFRSKDKLLQHLSQALVLIVNEQLM